MDKASAIQLEQKYLQEIFARNQMLLEAYSEIENLKQEMKALKDGSKEQV